MDDPLRISTLAISAEMLKAVAEIEEFKGAWTTLGRLEPERLNRLRRVATIESVGSSTRIEGARLSDRDVDRLLSNLQITTFGSRDEAEVVGYAAVMDTVFQSADVVPLTENHIRHLHRDLLEHVGKDSRHRGEYKKLDNHVEAFSPDGESLGVVFKTASPFETPARMAELVAWTREALDRGELHALLVIGVFVVVFLAIHPFQDGNGRLSRVLTTLLLIRAGYDHVPYASLESVIERSKDDYYRALRRTQGSLDSASPDWQPWLSYFLGALCAQKRVLQRKLERERALQAMPVLSARILAITREQGRITVAEAVKITGASRNTIKGHLRQLCATRQLRRSGAGRGSWYSPA